VTNWTLSDINWAAFDAARVDRDVLSAVKAAALVEYNSRDYVAYLKRVFDAGSPIVAHLEQWGEEEAQHGLALGRWAEMADPAFDFHKAFARFQAGYSLPQSNKVSVRGSRSGELISRCVVESGTSSYYTAMKEATEEPVLAEIAGLIAADEFRHYQLFYTNLQTCLAEERLPLWTRARVALGRFLEAEDDELAYAYYCANVEEGTAEYHRKTYSKAYERVALNLYRRKHFQRMVAMALKAVGLNPNGWFAETLKTIAWGGLRLRRRFLT